ncbi:MAG TPA: type II toxin-antitoxin system RelE/ParE family toxin [Tepidisphaeraceae bacterium]|nr:type II toxin-antitoxin system RelE/ParE family toxin [Tepidisphaeraceae bacterium]
MRKIGSATVRQKIVAKVSDLATADDPTQLGKPLVDELQGLYRLSFGRYRILYQIESNGQITIVVVMVGIRKHGDKIDVYELATRLKRQGKL